VAKKFILSSKHFFCGFCGNMDFCGGHRPPLQEKRMAARQRRPANNIPR
jgi:hypothetical protein